LLTNLSTFIIVMKKILIAALTPFVLTMPVMASLPSFAAGSGLTLLAQGTDTLKQMAQSFTVKILVGDTNGSGVIIGKTGNTYRVVTNAHVVTRSNSYKIQAPDDKVYTGKLLEKGSSLRGNDLAILTFDSTVNYGVATLAEGGSLKPNDVVYSAGFPIDQNNFMITSGTVTEITSQPLKGGYQLGYSADTLQGMSGGPLLNSAGQLIGIVGMGKGAALLEAYTYQDESRPGLDVINQWRGMSFAVPVATINQIMGDVAKVPSGEGQAVPKAKSYTGIVKKVDDIAQQVTVRIDAPNGENGSGTIVGKEGNTYSVLTACHVVSAPCKPENLIDNWVITMPDGEKLVVKSGKDAVTILNPDIDVAVIRFNSSKNYAVATIGNYTIKDEQWLFMTGFPGKDQSKQRLLTVGTVRAKEESAFVTKDQYSVGNGQELVYRNQSYGGMSGGGVFDTEGRLVGVNTGSENAPFIEQGEYQEIGLGYSLGVPITTFLGIAEAAKFSTQNLPKVANPASEVNDNEIQQIKAQLFRFQVPQSGATVADWVNYGNALWRAGEYTEAVRAFDRAITLLGKEKKGENLANIYYAKGLTLAHNGQDTEALKAFQESTTIFPQFPNAWRRQGFMLVNLQRYPEALIAYEQAIAKGDKQDFVLYVEQGGVLRELKRYPEALASYGQAISLKPNHPWAYVNRGLVYEQKGEKDLALNDYNLAILLNPKTALTYSNRGLVYEQKGEKDLALNDYNLAILLDPKFAWAYSNRGTLYAEKGEKDLALNDYNQAILLAPQLAMAYINRGKLYNDMGKKDLALKDYNQAILLDPKFAWAYNNRGGTYVDMGEKDLALKDYNQAILLDPKLTFTYINRGKLYDDMGKKDLALNDYNQAILLNPKFANAYVDRGNLYDGMGKKDLALKDYNQAILLDPKFVVAYVNRGLLYNDMGEKDLALKDYNQAILLDPKLAVAYVNRGLLYNDMGEKDLALQDYNQAININPKFANAYVNRGNLYAEKGENELALNDYNQSIILDPQDADTYYMRGGLYAKKGEKKLALQDYNQAILLNPQDAIAHFDRGILYYDIGEKDLALKDYNQAILLNPQYAEVYNNRGNFYDDIGEKDLALKDYNQAIKFNPQLAEAYYNRGSIYLEINNRQQAIQDLKIAAKLFYEQGNPAYQKVLEMLKQLGQ
jgi:tetratricopeptide (TPR) repeat protein/S1-C subfamily serine protease